MKPRLLAVLGPRPDARNPSGRVFFRHLRHLAGEGWIINVTDDGTAPDADAPSNLSLLPLPSRRPWWPPVRHSLFPTVRLRHHLLATHIARALRSTPPDVILTGGGHPHLDLARLVACRLGRPLHVLLHDWWPDLTPAGPARRLATRIQADLFPAATAVWAVSGPLAERAASLGARSAHVLPPLPSGVVPSSDTPRAAASPPRLVAFGSYDSGHDALYAALADRLLPLGGSLEIVTNQVSEARKNLAAHRNIGVLPYFPTARDAVDFAVSRCTAIVVAQQFSAAAHPWILTSFPSKLVEFVHAGLPVLILAHPDSALGAWARERRWQFFVSDLATPALDAALRDLDSPATRAAALACVSSVADVEFSPMRIHARLRDGLLASLPEHPPSP